MQNESVKWLVSGGVAGVTSKFIMLPFDIVKKRLEVHSCIHVSLGKTLIRNACRNCESMYPLLEES